MATARFVLFVSRPPSAQDAAAVSKLGAAHATLRAQAAVYTVTPELRGTVPPQVAAGTPVLLDTTANKFSGSGADALAVIDSLHRQCMGTTSAAGGAASARSFVPPPDPSRAARPGPGPAAAALPYTAVSGAAGGGSSSSAVSGPEAGLMALSDRRPMGREVPADPRSMPGSMLPPPPAAAAGARHGGGRAEPVPPPPTSTSMQIAQVGAGIGTPGGLHGFNRGGVAVLGTDLNTAFSALEAKVSTSEADSSRLLTQAFGIDGRCKPGGPGAGGAAPPMVQITDRGPVTPEDVERITALREAENRAIQARQTGAEPVRAVSAGIDARSLTAADAARAANVVDLGFGTTPGQSYMPPKPMHVRG